ncbi:MAG: hypothetical protein ACKVU2_12795, partial [Saprospiraceae bacterium]
MNNYNQKKCGWAVSLFLFLLAAAPVFSQKNWSGTFGSDWFFSGNWIPFGVPTATESVFIADKANDPIIGGSAVAQSVIVQVGAHLTVAAAGTLTINSSSIQNEGTVQNNGTITIGSIPGLGNYGLLNRGIFNNNTGGTISINRSTDVGIFNIVDGIFTNSGTITIGGAESVGDFGIHNKATFNNITGGQISINRSTIAGIFNEVGTFNNFTTINIGGTASVGESGIFNKATFNNGTGGLISIDRSTNEGIYNKVGTFNNVGTTTIGGTASV